MNKLIVPNAEFAIQQLKEEIAQELHIEIHPDMTSRDAGRIGGNLTRKLIELGKQSLAESINTPAITNNITTPENMLH